MKNLNKVVVTLKNFDNQYSVPNISARTVIYTDLTDKEAVTKLAIEAANELEDKNTRKTADYLAFPDDVEFAKADLCEKDITIEMIPNLGVDEKISDKYDSLSPFNVDEAVYTKKDGKMGLILLDGEVLIPCEMDEISELQNGIVFVKKDGKYGVYVTDADTLIAPIFDSASHKGYDSMVDVVLNGVKGYVNIDGEFVSQERYEKRYEEAEIKDSQLIWAYQKGCSLWWK